MGIRRPRPSMSLWLMAASVLSQYLAARQGG
jgi:hypothetical protein